jgi:hypothetical protein
MDDTHTDEFRIQKNSSAKSQREHEIVKGLGAVKVIF